MFQHVMVTTLIELVIIYTDKVRINQIVTRAFWVRRKRQNNKSYRFINKTFIKKRLSFITIL